MKKKLPIKKPSLDEQGGISSIAFISKEDMLTGFPEFIEYNGEQSKGSIAPFQPSITLRPETRPYWEQLGFKSAADMYKDAHMHALTANGWYCFTCGCSMEKCDLATGETKATTHI